MNFHQWINEKFIDWRGDTRRSVSEFSIWLNVSQPSVSAWLNGTRGQPTSAKVIRHLVEKFGSEVYEVLGMNPPSAPNLRSALQASLLPPELAKRLIAAEDEIVSELSKNGISKTSPEGLEIISRILSKHGITFSVTE